ncbi:MAG TPA: DMT family transporter [Solirubrobacteraceae bacterium]
MQIDASMVILYALAASVGWGAADFWGGIYARDTPVFVVIAVSQAISLIVLVPIMVAHGVPLPDDPRLLLACAAGVAATAELGLIYFALSRGDAFVTAPVAAVGAAMAVAIGLIGGDRLDLTIALGLLAALLGGGACAWTSRHSHDKHGFLRNAAICVGAAAGVAFAFTCFHSASELDPYWSTAALHVSMVLASAPLMLVGRGRTLRQRLPGRALLPALALIGIGDVGGDLAYAAASQHGELSIVSALASLYPLTTIALGLVLLRARAGRVQVAGVAIALAGAVLLGFASPH